jgi:serine/threonine protein kinase
MTLNYKISPESNLGKNEYLDIIETFGEKGSTVDDRGRNVIKKFELPELTVNVKSFKPPHLINSFAYKYVRKSKARRSFEYALKLLEKGIQTPEPLAYFEYSGLWGLDKSFYFSRHLLYEYTFYDLIDNYREKRFEALLRQFSKFAFELHEKGVYHKDFSAGNILITQDGGQSSFYLIDLNRMKFVELDFDLRMKNLSRLTEDEEVLRIMAEEYSAISGWDFEEVYDRIIHFTIEFRKKYNRRMDLKRRFLGREISKRLPNNP